MAARHRAVAIDVGTGDGAYARRLAEADPGLLVIGVDANVDGLRRLSRRAAAAPARAGLPNLLLGRLALERAPGELEGLADRLTVLHPWGSLLRAVAGDEPEGLRRLRALCAPGATIEVVAGAGDVAAPPGELATRYAAAGLAVSAVEIGACEAEALGTTWAKRLARSDPDRRFLRIGGAAVGAPTPGTAPRTWS